MTSKKLELLSVIGTRPELIKMAPVTQCFDADPKFSMRVCFTGQHTDLISSVMEVFKTPVDYQLSLMTANQSLYGFVGRCVTALGDLFSEVKPAAVLAQGDTSTTFCAALASFYCRIPFFHVEAGLRTMDLENPFPEEANRQLASRIARLHFAPTELARARLLAEGIAESSIIVTGNTVVDALLQMRRLIPPAPNDKKSSKRRVLATVHRRENFGQPLLSILRAIRRIACELDAEVILPVHPNPNVRAAVQEMLGNVPGVSLTEPMSYLDLLAELNRADLILTDSGGIQEEAPSFGKPVLVLRKVTERPEAIECGISKLVGSDEQAIFNETAALLKKGAGSGEIGAAQSPFGDGKAALRIRDAIYAFFQE